jgi:hypothetical protein
MSNHQESSEKYKQFAANWRRSTACIRGKTSSVHSLRDPVAETRVANVHKGETFPFSTFV